MIIHMQELPVVQRQNWLQHAIAPRPIGLVSSLNEKGEANLAPFSFFNLFSTNPPMVIFSPARRVRDNTVKHTFKNVYAVREVVVHLVSYDLVQQVSLASCEYPEGVDEFIKAGFTKEAARMVQPPMVKECPVKLECRVVQIQPLGKEGGAGNLIFGEVLCMHVHDEILTPDGSMIDQQKLSLVARLGGDWYCRVNAENLFKVPKPNTKTGIGFDALPVNIRNSSMLTGNDLALLANVEVLPERTGDIELSFKVKEMEPVERVNYVKLLLKEGRVEEAWQVLLI